MVTSEEIWKPIPGFPGYEVSDQGDVRSYRKRGRGGSFYIDPHLLKPSPDGKYRQVCLRKNGQSHVKHISTLVLLAFVGPKPSGLEACHNDGDHANDKLTNLRYDSHDGNMKDLARLNSAKRQQMSDALISKLWQIKADRPFSQMANEVGNLSGHTLRRIMTGGRGGLFETWKIILQAYPQLKPIFISSIYQL
jgi:hypothetical protein